MTRARRPSTPPGPEVILEAERAYAAALARVDRLRAALPPGAFEARLRAGFARTKRTGAGVHDPDERARLKGSRRAANRAAHRRAQDEHRADTPPTRKQRQMLWCLGYRGPAPRSQAEVSALVAELTGRGA